MRFFVGLHQPSDACHFDCCMVSVGRLRRVSSEALFDVSDWIMDSQAFTTVKTYGGYPHPVEEYAGQINRWKHKGRLLAAVSQDYMCEPFILKITKLTVAEHQRLTIERYDALLRCATDCYIMPVIQGYEPSEYVSHIYQYGDRLIKGAWVGVGSICKRNSNPCLVLDVLMAIKAERPDLRLHGFGLKTTALTAMPIRQLLESSDSMAWSYAARREGRDPNDWRNAAHLKRLVEQMGD